MPPSLGSMGLDHAGTPPTAPGVGSGTLSAGNSTAAPAHGGRFWLQLVASSKLVLGTQTL